MTSHFFDRPRVNWEPSLKPEHDERLPMISHKFDSPDYHFPVFAFSFRPFVTRSRARHPKHSLRKPGAGHGELRSRGADLVEVFSHQVHIGGSDVFLQSVQLRGARNRNDPGLLRQQPRERDLRRRNIFASRNIAEQIDERQIRLAGLGRKTWNEIPEVGTLEAGILVDFPGEETRAERAEGDEANPKLLARRKNLR